ncbi:uncharacterized protein V1516DRAFT_679077 [Lipomyces oligophaga]|uniref:uncharacterized protein n=1 Tax=Lipomyces oligophaga TaxID=45792 RepID=UPI0034CFB33A
MADIAKPDIESSVEADAGDSLLTNSTSKDKFDIESSSDDLSFTTSQPTPITPSTEPSSLLAREHVAVDIPFYPVAESAPLSLRARLLGSSIILSAKLWFDANIGLLLVASGQLFSSTMNLLARILEVNSKPPFHALQIVFVRMSITTICCTLYMIYRKVPDAPFGPRTIRSLLVARGMVGFFGLFGMYYSLTYLSLSDATVISFLSPTVAGFACSIFLGEQFGRRDFLAGLVSFFGVVLIAQPGIAPSDPDSSGRIVTSSQRWGAIGVALLGVLGAAGAFTIIRCIGKRAHPLISVNYFASMCTVVSFLGIMLSPTIEFVLPHSTTQWVLLLGIGACGFLYQFLLTSGLQREKAGRASNMLYLQMFFAFMFERIVWNDVPNWMELTGSGVILGSAIWVAVSKRRSETVYAKVGSGSISEVPQSPETESYEMNEVSRRT